MHLCSGEGTYYFKDFHIWYLVGSFAVGLFAFQWYVRGGGGGVESFNMDILNTNFNNSSL